MTPVASFGMYDSPALHAANDLLWSAVADELRRLDFANIPRGLERERPLDELWIDPGLVLGQTCGYPLVTRLRGQVRLVCTPVYAAPECGRGRHRAAVIVRTDDPAATLAELRGRRCAVNEVSSNTGCNLLRRSLADVAGGRPFLAAGPLMTGSHAASLAAVVEGDADFAAVDGVTLAHLQRDAAEMTRAIRVLSWTRSSPCLPFVTGLATPPGRLRLLRRALRQAIATLRPETRARLMLRGVVASPLSRYDEIATIEREAAALGYPELV